MIFQFFNFFDEISNYYYLNETPFQFAVLKGNTSIVSLLANNRQIDINMLSTKYVFNIKIFIMTFKNQFFK